MLGLLIVILILLWAYQGILSETLDDNIEKYIYRTISNSYSRSKDD